MQTIIIRNPGALENPELVAFLRRAVAAFPYAAGKEVGLEGVIEDIFTFITNPSFFLVVGIEKGNFTTLCVMERGASKMFPMPTIFCFYNEGSVKVKHAVMDRVLEIVRELGYTRFRTANMSGLPDEVWLKAFQRTGVGFDPIGTIFEMTLE
jgi:hypothetical protein